MGNTINKPRGTQDFVGQNAANYDDLVNKLNEVALLYGATPMMVPTFEESKLYKRGVGETTDIVTKETFDLQNKGGHEYTLRPEFTAGIMRSVIENKLYASPDMPLRFFYSGSCYRYERPQTGRYRELHQWGIEFLDTKLDNSTVTEAIMLLSQAVQKLGLHPVLHINSLGSIPSRLAYKKALQEYFSQYIENMCEDCKVRLENNPLRILDCKVPEDRVIIEKAPRISDYLTEEDKADYQQIKDILDANGIKYVCDDLLVRGLDYYTGLVFEIYLEERLELGALGAGGRYDGLCKALGGPDLAGVGFSFGLDRLLLALSGEDGVKLNPDVMVLVDSKHVLDLTKIKQSLRQENISVISPSIDKTLNGALKMADRLGAKVVVFVGDDNIIKVKDLSSREQVNSSFDEIIGKIKEMLHVKK